VLLAPDLTTARGAGAMIQRAGGQMADVLENLLEVSTLDAAQPSLAKSEVDLVPLARDVVAIHGQLAAMHRIALALHAEVDPLLARVDGRRIKRLLLNLVGNALKYTPDGGRIDVHLSAGDTGCELAVRDTAPGDLRALSSARWQRRVRPRPLYLPPDRGGP
jgi:signal transduction histidine kinase